MSYIMVFIVCEIFYTAYAANDYGFMRRGCCYKLSLKPH